MREDKLYISKNVLAKSNAEPVGKVASIVKLLGREVASPSEAREILRLKYFSKGDE
jgi:3-keto-5-aminohexanoate cleavage enzyme